MLILSRQSFLRFSRCGFQVSFESKMRPSILISCTVFIVVCAKVRFTDCPFVLFWLKTIACVLVLANLKPVVDANCSNLSKVFA